jgi:3-phosphoshikimate 1-carboxyvinyltransferase
MNRIISPFRYKGSVNINSSKSYFQRALAISLISESKVELVGNSCENDILTTLNICEKAGLCFKKTKNSIKIDGKTTNLKKSISVNSDESGFCARVFSVVLSHLFNDVTINGFGSAINRSFNFSCLSQLGLKINTKDLSLPVNIKGEMQSGEICIDASDSSQLLSGLLITLPFLSSDSVIHVKDLVSCPYIDMTIGILKDFGVDITNESHKRFFVKGNQQIKSSKYIIEGDWSGAAFHLVGAAISGEVKIYGLNPNSLQADKAILKALCQCGAEVIIKEDFIEVKRLELNSFSFDATDSPDLFPSLVSLASCCKGVSVIKGVRRLINKESNRANSIKIEFAKIGVKVILKDNHMYIHGSKVIKGAIINSHNDHRIAMALSIMGSVSKGPINITDSEVVAKSYSNFYKDLEILDA